MNDHVLEKSFAQCSTMADARKLAEKHPGLKKAVKTSLQPSISLLERRAEQGTLKGNYFETFTAATDEDIESFLTIIKTIDTEFDVKEFLDKKKPYHYSPALKEFLDCHVTFTHYAITFKRQEDMNINFLSQNYPEMNWTESLDPVPCPVFDKENEGKFVSYDVVNSLSARVQNDLILMGKI